VKNTHCIDRQILGAAAAVAVFLTGCSGASDSGDGRSSGTATGGSTLPGNEAIPDIGTLPHAGTVSTSGGNGASGGNASAIGGAVVGAGGASTSGGSAIAAGGAFSTGGKSNGGAAAAAGGLVSSGGNNAGGRGGQGASLGGQGPTGGLAAAGGQATIGGSSSKGGAGGAVTNAGGAIATGGTAAIAGTAAYHTLANWVSPVASNKNHHGRMYFIAKAQKDDQGLACNACHGTNFEGTASAPACASCHSAWRSCNFCHGTGAAQYNPPRGVFDESATSTLAVGRHAAHLAAGTSHPAFACNTCHTIPAANDLTHLLQYVPSSDLTTPGHHGDVTFSAVANATTWNVGATTGTPASARGTCVGACHSNGRGGAPAKTPYWAGGTWATGCTNCHGATGSTRNSEHGHGFPGSTCADCHTGATATSYTASTHMNGIRDIRTSPGGRAAGMKLTANWSCSSVPCH